MPAVRTIKNQYLGINAHLHSFWQATATWNRFHKVHVVHLMADLKAQLIPLGYTAHLDYSLQAEKSDTGINAIAIHTYPSESKIIGWIELISPIVNLNHYREMRNLYLERQTVFIELDYLHESPPIFKYLPDYKKDEVNAHAYHILIADPHPSLKEGKVYIYPFDVDAHLPRNVNIPLNARDELWFDFNVTYQRTFERALFGDSVDYAKFPIHFDRYSPADQTRVARRMLAVLKAHQAGGDLENAPFPIEKITLEDAIAQIESLTAAD